MENETSVYNAEEARKKQAEYCKQNGAPHFAPESGRCWKCHRNIYEPWTRPERQWSSVEQFKEVTTGITVERAAAGLVTGCPHCHRSYCD